MNLPTIIGGSGLMNGGATTQIRLLLDARKLGDGGIGVYIENLIEGLLGLQENNLGAIKITLLVSPQRSGEAARLILKWGSRLRIVEDDAKKYSLDEMLRMPKRLRGILQDINVFHSPHFTLPYGLRVPTIVTVHDAILADYPEKFYQPPIIRRLIRSAISRATRTITVSGASLARLHSLLPAETPPMTVIPNAVNREIFPYPRPQVQQFLFNCGLTKPYLLFVGTDRPHKGFKQLVEAFSIMCSSQQFLEQPNLVVVGQRFSSEAREFAERHLGKDCTVFLGDVPREALVLLYNGSSGVVVPSRVEGFGLPALEALACGVPVICTPEPALMEVCGNAAWFAENYSPDSIAAAIISSQLSSELRDLKISQGLSRVRDYQPEDIAARTLEVYLDALALTPRLASGNKPLFSSTGASGGAVFGEHLKKAI